MYPDIDWPGLRCVGFDLDGTLYDEFDFIDQVYTAIVETNADLLSDPDGAGRWMRERWLEKGSSYAHIFDEAFARFGRDGARQQAFIDNALHTFRHFRPELRLPLRSRQLLDRLRVDYQLFLISDGNPELQRRKFAALGLARWFAEDDCVFTGEHGADWHKPSTRALDRLALAHPPAQCLFFGDRELDAQFAAAANMAFVRVYNMIGKLGSADR